MTQELVDKLIAHYERVKELVEKSNSLEDARKICALNFVSAGICRCSLFVCGVDLTDDVWVEKKAYQSLHKESPFYWHDCPRDASSQSEIVECLQARIDILKTFPE